MAWRSSGRTNKELVANLKKNGVFSSERVRIAMELVDRADFAKNNPYEDSPQRIGFNATISAPHMHAAALEYLKDHLEPGCSALDVGSGSGYLTACMGIMVGSNGSVVGIEHIPELVKLGIKNLEKNHGNLLKTGNIKIIEGDGRLGYPSNAPYNAIHVGAAAQGVPQSLIEQLAAGGRMMIPVEMKTGNQVFMQIDKQQNGTIVEKVVEHVVYVPLTDRNKQLGILRT
ncbi:unnamed protein product [Caenorhabditis angaria]|uniref:Protein-L-isoaspartate O-methyltransferase n=1 Tax=Caenorhabditis angaria TaxID=860376 RepID=A0A9P1IX15_9PELO|nr:unnamed protein product [Caenorhabditis angaria]